MLNAITIDVEEWFQVLYFESVVKREDWGRYESRLEDNTCQLLDILRRYKTKATFFVLGWNAEHYPELVKRIESEGHEIASHGYFHRLVYQQTLQEFYDDVKRSKEVLEDITGKKVLGFRAPSASITSDTIWAFDALQKLGFRYDSSVLPVKRSYCGMDGVPYHSYKIKVDSNSELIEYPLQTINIFGKRIPFAGGGYMRLLPYWMIKSSIKRMNSGGKPVMIYLHPWEIDLDPPKLKIPIREHLRFRFSHYINLSGMLAKINALLKDFKFTTMRDILELE